MKNKRFYIFFSVFIIVFSALVVNNISVNASSKKQIYNVYKKFLENYPKESSLYECYGGNAIGDFGLIDLNNDGIKELYVYGGNFDEGIFYWNGKKLSCIITGHLGYSGIDKVYKSGNIFRIWHMKADGYAYYKLNKGKLTCIAQYCGNDNFRMNEKKEYWLGNKLVSKKKFKNFEKKINKRKVKYNGISKIKKYRNTKKNRNKILSIK